MKNWHCALLAICILCVALQLNHLVQRAPERIIDEIGILIFIVLIAAWHVDAWKKDR